MKKSASPWVYATLFAYTSSQINRGYILIMIKATLKIDKKQNTVKFAFAAYDSRSEIIFYSYYDGLIEE